MAEDPSAWIGQNERHLREALKQVAELYRDDGLTDQDKLDKIGDVLEDLGLLEDE